MFYFLKIFFICDLIYEKVQMAPVTVFLFSHWFAGVFVAIQATESKQLNPPINLWFSKFLFKITSLEHWIKIKWQLKCQRNSANCRKTNFLKYSWNSQENSKVRAYWFTSKKYSVAVALLIEKLFCSISVALFLNTFLKKKEKWVVEEHVTTHLHWVIPTAGI